MNEVEITVRFGVGNGRIVSVPEGTTIGQVVDDQTTRSALGYPAGVRALIRRVQMDRNHRVVNGDVIDLETVGTIKAS